MLRPFARMKLRSKQTTMQPPLAKAVTFLPGPEQTSPVMSRNALARGRFAGQAISIADPIPIPTLLQNSVPYYFPYGPAGVPLFFKFSLQPNSVHLFVSTTGPMSLFAKSGALLPLTQWEYEVESVPWFNPTWFQIELPQNGFWFVMAWPESAYGPSGIRAKWFVPP